MVFSLGEIMFRASRSSSSSSPPPPPNKQSKTLEQQNLHPGLKALIQHKEKEEINSQYQKQYPHHHDQITVLHSHTVVPKPSSPTSPWWLSSSSSSPSSSSSSSSSSLIVLDLERSCPSSMGDLIGTESGVYMSSNVEDLPPPPPPPPLLMERMRSSTLAAKKEYPPPIPGRMLTRQYSEDGRLIIRQTKVQRHEYFHAHRQDGRLVLNLILIDHHEDGEDDDDDDDDDCGGDPKEMVVVVVSEEEEEEDGKIKSSVEDDEDKDEDGIEQRRRERNVGKFVFPKFMSTYASEMFMDSKKYCLGSVKNKVFMNELGPSHSYLDQPSSSSSSSSCSLPLRPMAAAM